MAHSTPMRRNKQEEKSLKPQAHVEHNGYEDSEQNQVKQLEIAISLIGIAVYSPAPKEESKDNNQEQDKH